MSREDRIEFLIQESLLFDHLSEMGMIGNSGKLAMREACIRNSAIKKMQKELEIDNKTLKKLKSDAQSSWRV